MKEYARSISELAQHFGVNRRTIQDWFVDGAPKKTDKGYDVIAIAEWRKANRRPMPPKPAEELCGNELTRRMQMAKLKEQEAKANKVEAEAVIAQYKELTLKDDICYVRDVENWVSAALTAFRNEIQKIPAQLASGYAPEIQEQLKVDIEERLDISLRALHSRLSDIKQAKDD